MTNIVQIKDLFQQWHQEKNINLDKLEEAHQTKMMQTRRFIRLADENSSGCAESDEPEYDSYNEHETDFCRDSGDDSSCDGYSTDQIVEVCEYDVDDLSASEDLYTDDGSSGDSDELMLAAVARAIFDSSSSSGTEQFEILAADADTEESDAPTDPELGRSDYWTCIKCKNQKNNPMYRFCEKCYQIRKTHFPPRPRHRKKRKSKLPITTKKISKKHSLQTMSPDDKVVDYGCISRSSSDCSEKFGILLNSSKPESLSRRKCLNIRNCAGDSSFCSSQEMSPDEQQPHFCPSSQETYCSEIERIVVDPKQMRNDLNINDSFYSNSPDSGISEASSQLSHTSLCVNAVPVMQTSSTISQASTISMDSQDTIKSVDSGELDTQISMSSIGSIEKRSRKRKATKKVYEMITDESDVSDQEDGHIGKRLKATDHFDDNSYGVCRICLTQPKNAAFLHNQFIHIYSCYKCSVKVWNKRKKCPICNSRVKAVLKFSVY